MRFFLFPALCLLAVCSIFFPSRPACAEENSATREIAVRSVQADFIPEKHLQILAQPLLSRGRFVFRAPDSLRWEYTSPFHSVLLMDKGRVKKFIEKNGRMVEDTGMPMNGMQVVMTEISGWLDGRFSDNDAFTVRRKGRTVTLIPKRQGMRAVISAIELRLAEQAGLLQSVTIVEDPGGKSFTRMLFSHALLNQPIDEHLFSEP